MPRGDKPTTAALALKDGWIYEDALPADISKAQYDWWFKESLVLDGVRMGPPLPNNEQATLEPCPKCGDSLALHKWKDAEVSCGRCGFNAPFEAWQSRADTRVSAASTAPVVNKWSKESPKVNGVYWWRADRADSDPDIHRVVDGIFFEVGEQFPRVVEGFGGEWLGPIFPDIVPAAASPAAPAIAELLKEVEPSNANYDAVDLAERVRRVCNRLRNAERLPSVSDAIAAVERLYDEWWDVERRTWLNVVLDRLRALPNSTTPAAPQEDALIDEVQYRMDQVVEAAVEWHQAGREGGEWFEAAEKLGAAINSLLDLRDEPGKMPRRWCSVHNREEFKYESLEHELNAPTPSQPARDAAAEIAQYLDAFTSLSPGAEMVRIFENTISRHLPAAKQ